VASVQDNTSVAVQGSVLALLLYDVCEEIRLEDLRKILGARTVTPSPKTAAPELIRFARPPVVEPLGELVLGEGERVNGQIKYYDYGVVSVILELPFNGEWDTLTQLSSRWMWDPEFERRARAALKQKLGRAEPALIKPYKDWLIEDYFIFQLRAVAGVTTAAELIAKHGAQIAQIVRGETTPLGDSERNEVLQSSVSYYVNDVAFIGWNSALVFDTASGAQTACELLEYANSQLLEFRHYDELLTQQLEGVYKSLQKGTGALARWRLAREATRLQSVLVEVTQLTERADNAIKFLSDMFSARLYRMAAVRVGVVDYKNLVNRKLETAEDLYRFMMDQFYQGRAFILEFIVVIILVIELYFFFRGKPI
jgi:hypothetical protein